MVSDSRPNTEDVTQYLTQLKNRRGGASDILSKKQATSMRKKQDYLIANYVYTTEDIQKAIKNKKRVGNIAAEKTRVNIAVQAAQNLLEDAVKQKGELETDLLEADAKDEDKLKEELDKIKERIEELENDLKDKIEEREKILKQESLRIKQLTQNEKNLKWAKVNEKAKVANKQADVEAYKNELALHKSGQKTTDIFARRKAKPQILWDVGQKKEDENDNRNEKINDNNETEGTLQDENDEAGNFNASSRDLRNGLKKKLSEQIIEMPIDEEAIPRLIGSNKKPRIGRVRRGMSLSEYFERKAAGTL